MVGFDKLLQVNDAFECYKMEDMFDESRYSGE